MSRITVCDNSSSEHPLTEAQTAALSPYAGITLQELNKREKNLLIFPHSLGANEDDIGSQTLFDIAGGTGEAAFPVNAPEMVFVVTAIILQLHFAQQEITNGSGPGAAHHAAAFGVVLGNAH